MMSFSMTPFATESQAEVRKAFDEQRLKREWDEAEADVQDATERKAMILWKARVQWPMVPGVAGQMKHHPEMRRFVRDTLGMADARNGGINTYATKLLQYGAEGARAKTKEATAVSDGRRSAIRRAVVELVTKYKLGADARACMDALARVYEENSRGKA